ncbi:transmembrane protein 135-like [Convolutriloba macropyga]|uniref:transmembrane protein 135-like n=1 Tax=Convolutriloba macropyga TaxID=536237 RepID=UPI003F51B57D
METGYIKLPILYEDKKIRATIRKLGPEKVPCNRHFTTFWGSNLKAVEVLFNRMVEYRQIATIKHSEVIMFVLASGILGCFFKSTDVKMKITSHDVEKPLAALIGPYEDVSSQVVTQSRLSSESQSSSHDDADQQFDNATSDPMSSLFRHKRCKQLLKSLNRLFCTIANRDAKSRLCLHPQPCIQYITYGAVRGFSIGYVLSTLLAVVRNIPRVSQPTRFLSRVFTRHNTQAALFLSLFISSFRVVSCCLRSVIKSNSALVGAISGTVSGLSFVVFRSYIISLYLFLKAAEILVKYLTKDTWLERLPRKSEFIYAVSAAEAIFAVTMWPQNVRPDYRKFLHTISDHKLQYINRQLASAHWNLKLKDVPEYTALDPKMQLLYEAMAQRSRLRAKMSKKH